MSLPVQVGTPAITINRDDRFLVSQPDGRIDATADEGFFVRDTRMASGYELTLNGVRPTLLNAAPIRFFSARHQFSNPPLLDGDGAIARQTIVLRLDRTMAGGLHEDYDVVNHGPRAVTLTLEIRIDSDFADLFDVKDRRLIRRGRVNSRWYRTAGELRTGYVNGPFRRQLVIRAENSGTSPSFANGRLTFVFELQPKEAWHTCLKWLPIVDDRRRPTTLGCSAVTESRAGIAPPRLPRVGLVTDNHTVRSAWEQAVRDMDSLRLEDRPWDGACSWPRRACPGSRPCSGVTR